MDLSFLDLCCCADMLGRGRDRQSDETMLGGQSCVSASSGGWQWAVSGPLVGPSVGRDMPWQYRHRKTRVRYRGMPFEHNKDPRKYARMLFCPGVSCSISAFMHCRSGAGAFYISVTHHHSTSHMAACSSCLCSTLRISRTIRHVGRKRINMARCICALPSHSIRCCFETVASYQYGFRCESWASIFLCALLRRTFLQVSGT
jgi:hypothetical protein